MAHRLTSAIAVLPCADVQGMVRFYTERLGFEQRWTWPDAPHGGDAPHDAGVASGDVQIFFTADAGLARSSAHHELLIFTDDIDACHADLRARGAPVVSAPVDGPWGVREFSVLDPHGHRLRFAESMESVRARNVARATAWAATRRPASPSSEPSVDRPATTAAQDPAPPPDRPR